MLSLPWLFKSVLATTPLTTLRSLNLSAYFVDVLTFYFLLCYRPFGIQFHVETSLFNVYFAKLDRGTVKPVRWGVSDEQLDQVKSFGVKTFEDFTWKHMLDFYSCADCGRCSDKCPANAVGRPLSPRFLTTKARDYAFQHYPMFGKTGNGHQLIGGIYSEDEIWSCTTCGACEEECPLLIEYIDKIVDLRRGMIDDGNVRSPCRKPLKALESRGNPYGKMEKKRAEWTKAKDFQQTCNVKMLDGKSNADTLYFRRQHHLVRRPHAGDWPSHGEDSRSARARISEFSARRKKTAAMRSGVLAKRCCSWRCATTTWMPSRRRA